MCNRVYQDAYFEPIFDAQKGALPYPDRMRAELDEVKAKLIALEQAKVSYPPVEDAATGKEGKPQAEQPDPKLARTVAEEEHKAKVEKAAAEEAAARQAKAEAPAGDEATADKSKARRPRAKKVVANEAAGQAVPEASADEGAVVPAAAAAPNAKDEPPKKPALAREVANELRGENDTRSDADVMDAIKKKAAQAKMDEFDARLFRKKKAA